MRNIATRCESWWGVGALMDASIRAKLRASTLALYGSPPDPLRAPNLYQNAESHHPNSQEVHPNQIDGIMRTDMHSPIDGSYSLQFGHVLIRCL